MNELSGAWIVGLGLVVLLLALGWARWFPGVTDSQPETIPAEPETAQAPFLQRDVPP